MSADVHDDRVAVDDAHYGRATVGGRLSRVLLK